MAVMQSAAAAAAADQCRLSPISPRASLLFVYYCVTPQPHQPTGHPSFTNTAIQPVPANVL